jgi:hypothetical protein
MLNLEDFFCSALNVFGDLMPMRRAGQKGAENEHIERALQQSHAA